MTEETEYMGQWWTPEDPERKFYGLLKIRKKGPSDLELYEYIEIYNGKIISNIISHKPYSIVLGDCYNITEKKRELITLLSGDLISIDYISVNHYYSKYRFDTIIFGANYKNKDEISFDSISIRYPFLYLWTLGMTDLEIIDLNSKSYEIKQTLIEPFKIKISDSINVLIEFIKNSEVSAEKEQINPKENTIFKIESSKKMHIDEFHSLRRNIDLIFSLGYGEAIYPSSILCHVEKGRTVKLIKSEFISEELIKPRRPQDMLFKFSDIKDRFGDMVSNFVIRAKEIEIIYDLYIRVVYGQNMNDIFRFLSLAHALEAYHRITSKGTKGNYLEKNEYKEIKLKLDALIDESSDNTEFKEAMKRQIQHGNQFALRKRLEILFKKYSGLFDFLEESKDSIIDSITKDIVNSRNYYIHYDERNKKKAKKGKELYYLSIILKILLEICLLNEFGFSFEEIQSKFLKKWNIVIRSIRKQLN